MQRRAAIWILGTYRTFPTGGIKAIVGLISIKFHFHKLASRSQLHSAALPKNHLIKTLIENALNTYSKPSLHSINSLTDRQKSSIKDHLVDSYNKLHGILPSFFPLDPELTPGSRVTDTFQDQFSFNLSNKAKNDTARSQQLNDMTIASFLLSHMALIVSDASIQHDIATSVSHIHMQDKPLIKTVHHGVFVTSTEAELFTIRYGFNQACNEEEISKIIVVTDSIHAAKNIFNTKSYPYQIHATTILKELRQFFSKRQENHIEFWECPSYLKWNLHRSANKDSKAFKPVPVLQNKIS